MSAAPTVPGFRAPTGEFWLFAYGSLMWQPDFRYAAQQAAVLRGYHRALCVHSWVYRGTAENPGLVFGLDRGGICKGIAYRIRGRDARAVYARVHAREMVTGVYRPRWVTLALAGQRRVTALAYVADPAHEQYAGRLTDAEALARVRRGSGCAGPCVDYVLSTARHLRQLGIRDLVLERLARKLSALPS